KILKASPGSRFWHRRKQSIQIDNNILKEEFSQDTDPKVGDDGVHIDSDNVSSADSSLQVQDVNQTKANEARRALKALKGLARVRARRVRIALESQSSQQKIQEQLQHEAHAKEIETLLEINLVMYGVVMQIM
ncbi:hypothetical protein MKW98_001522, partial [Papaver atlanticum]